ncbi:MULTISPECIES: hypothetical protein [Pseudomonas]|uniref:hypothetical protein n=1 Tax=Pseudomonas TaxID=286 RepID=UPI00053DCECE|nr:MULTISPECIES: hypothetical protein [Pseudomonas]EKU3769505.1 hypothetical protein [Pseudomonas aeruginosa]EKX9011373.1 hypothetical protein [Pseudomonas aeruginosa]MBG7279451.1 hypothetical protein [Pseudomonas aeruginosa]MBI7767601.1 hypothetical protein [Pseudomonas aeruginosa]MBO8372160.1 hypothetical protein [Pseudomonas aeruginosa]
MKLLLRTFAAVFVFAGILAGCLAMLLLVIVMVRFPPLLVAVVLACWILCRLMNAFRRKDQSEASRTAPQ